MSNLKRIVERLGIQPTQIGRKLERRQSHPALELVVADGRLPSTDEGGGGEAYLLLIRR